MLFCFNSHFPASDLRQPSLYVMCVLRFSFTSHPFFVAYAVKGWWLDKFMKDGKMGRHTYLDLAAKVTVGFARRRNDAKARRWWPTPVG